MFKYNCANCDYYIETANELINDKVWCPKCNKGLWKLVMDPIDPTIDAVTEILSRHTNVSGIEGSWVICTNTNAEDAATLCYSITD